MPILIGSQSLKFDRARPTIRFRGHIVLAAEVQRLSSSPQLACRTGCEERPLWGAIFGKGSLEVVPAAFCLCHAVFVTARNDFACCWQFDLTRLRRIPAQRLMRAHVVIVGNVLAQNA